MWGCITVGRLTCSRGGGKGVDKNPLEKAGTSKENPGGSAKGLGAADPLVIFEPSPDSLVHRGLKN